MPRWNFQQGIDYQIEPYARDPMYFGVELEMAAPDTNDIYTIIEPWSSFISMSGDCSIEIDDDRDLDLELKFHPGTWNWWLQNRTLINTTLRKLVRCDAESGKGRNCGMHVHMSRVLSTDHILNLLQLVYQHPQQILEFSHRDMRSLCTWARPTLSRNTSTCQCPSCREARCEEISGEFDHTKYSMSTIANNYARGVFNEKYNAVHLCSETLEVRIFEGTLLCSQFWANLEFCRALVEYTGKPDYDFNTQCTWKLFHKWVSSNTHMRCLQRALNSVEDTNE